MADDGHDIDDRRADPAGQGDDATAAEGEASEKDEQESHGSFLAVARVTLRRASLF
jgi:hypothetical protein